MRLHRLHGCLVASDLDLHLPEAQTSLVPEMSLRRSAASLDADWTPQPDDVLAVVRDEARGVGYVAAKTPDGYRLHFDGLCAFDLSRDLGEVSWAILPERDPGLVAVLATGALMAFRLIMAGQLVLHASAVRARGRGLAFVGNSGMGKSTMATLMCAGGASLLTDDVAPIDLRGGGALLSPGGAESRLRPAAAPIMEMFGSSSVRRTTSDGRTAVSLCCWTDGPVTLDAVVVPLPSRDQAVLKVDPVSAAQALILLNEFPRIPGWVDAEVRDRQFNLLADLIERVPVYLAVVPWGPPFATETSAQLLDGLGWASYREGADGVGVHPSTGAPDRSP